MTDEVFMIRGYSDRAANERTFLAWLRTGIAVIAFGFGQGEGPSVVALAVMFWPYMIPYSVTVGSAAAPENSLSLFWGAGIFVLPVSFRRKPGNGSRRRGTRAGTDPIPSSSINED
jgi:hypothetical protein